jgi:hypothetical protein
VISLHEIYRLTLKKEGRETAELRTSLISKDFKIVDNSKASASSCL